MSSLFSRLKEYEHSFQELKRGNPTHNNNNNNTFKLVSVLRNTLNFTDKNNLNGSSTTSLNTYVTLRNALRCMYERLLVEESVFSLSASLHLNLWQNCYADPIESLESVFSPKDGGFSGSKINLNELAVIKSFLVAFIDEGIQFYRLLLKCFTTEAETENVNGITSNQLRYDFLINLATLMRKREILTTSQSNNFNNSNSFILIQEAITSSPLCGRGYLKLSEWAKEDGDTILSFYWGLLSLSADTPDPNSKAFLIALSKQIVTSPSFYKKPTKADIEKSASTTTTTTHIVEDQICQMMAHCLLNRTSHLDQLYHSQLPIDDHMDFKSIKYVTDSLWILVGNQEIFPNPQVNPLQTCLLGKLFHLHEKFYKSPLLFSSLLAFPANPQYSRLFSGENYEIIKKINPSVIEKLNSLLILILSDKINFSDCANVTSTSTSTSTNTNNHYAHTPHDVYDYLMIANFKSYRSAPQVTFKALIEHFLEIGLYTKDTNNETIQLKGKYEKSMKIEKSMKLLTQRLLESRIESLEETTQTQTPIDPNIPWTILDFTALISQFGDFKKSIKSRTGRFIISFTILEELDAKKNFDQQVRDVIRYLFDRVKLNDPSIRLQGVDECAAEAQDLDTNEFKRIESFELKKFENSNFTKANIRFQCEHLKNIRHLHKHHSDGNIYRVVCGNPILYACLLQDEIDLHATI